jgi:hypothetical protein
MIDSRAAMRRTVSGDGGNWQAARTKAEVNC